MVEVIETLWIPMPDGTKLAARIWLPDGARKAPIPCLLEYIPYRRRDRTRLRDESMHPQFAAAGYASVRVDIRGYGDSDGLAEDEYSHQETQDGCDIIAWLAAQEWCDGNVGMFGKSWGAYNAFQVAAKRPPALKAIIPVMGTDDRWREDIHFYGGCLANDNFWWGSIMQLYNAMPPDPEIVGPAWVDMWRLRLEGAKFWPAMWLEHQTHDEMWRRGSICENYADVDIPVYYFGGWADLYRDTAFRIAEHLTGPVKVMMGPWAHLYPQEGKPLPQVDFISLAVRFWDHWLKGIDTGLMEEPSLSFYIPDSCPPNGTQNQRSGRWIQEQAWPSPNITNQRLWLNEGGLGQTPESGAVMSVCTPQTFGAAGGDMFSFAIAGDLPIDGRMDGDGALVFTGPKLEHALDILGQPQVDLVISADQPQGFLVVLLMDQSPDGAQALISRGFFNLTHRESNIKPSAIEPGQDIKITVPLHAIGHRISQGHRLVVKLASSYWPILWPAPAPVTLNISSGTGSLCLPTRPENKDDAPYHPPTPNPATTPNKRVTCVRPGSMDRSYHVDLTTGKTTHRMFSDGGVFGPVGDMKLDEIGTILSDISDRKYQICADDPLSAKATMEQTAKFTRDDWQVKIWAYAEQTATADTFHLRSHLKAWIKDELFFEQHETHQIPRNGM